MVGVEGTRRRPGLFEENLENTPVSRPLPRRYRCRTRRQPGLASTGSATKCRYCPARVATPAQINLAAPPPKVGWPFLLGAPRWCAECRTLSIQRALRLPGSRERRSSHAPSAAFVKLPSEARFGLPFTAAVVLCPYRGRFEAASRVGRAHRIGRCRVPRRVTHARTGCRPRIPLRSAPNSRVWPRQSPPCERPSIGCRGLATRERGQTHYHHQRRPSR